MNIDTSVDPVDPDASAAGSDLRRILIESALVILRDPDRPLDLRKVAEGAGKSRTAPYLVFGKESEGGGLVGLRLAVAAEGTRLLSDRMLGAARATPDPFTAFGRAVSAFFHFAEENSRLVGLMYGPDVNVPNPPTSEVRSDSELARFVSRQAEAGDVLTELVVECQHAGLLPVDSGDGADAGGLRITLVAWASMIGLAHLRTGNLLRASRIEVPIDDAVRSVTEAVFAMDPDLAERAVRLFHGARRSREQDERAQEANPAKPGWSPRDDGWVGRLFRRPSGDAAGLDVSSEDPPNTSSAETADVVSVASMLASNGGLRRVVRASGLPDVPLLWVSAAPAGVAPEVDLLHALGASVDVVNKTSEAGAKLTPSDTEKPYRLVILDLGAGDRRGSERSGVDRRGEGRAQEARQLVERMQSLGSRPPILLYGPGGRQGPGPAAGAYGLARDVDELMHLVVDVLDGRPGFLG